MRHKDCSLKNISRAMVIIFLFLLGDGGVAFPADEKKEGGLVGTLTGQKISVDPKSGKEVLVPADGVLPGDLVLYTIVYQNREETALSGIVIATPIPRETTWVIRSEKAMVPSRMEASIDGGKQYQTPPILVPKKGPDGKENIMIEAPISAYTDLRWILSTPLGPGEKAVVTYRVQVK